jgi:hypothetical protein
MFAILFARSPSAVSIAQLLRQFLAVEFAQQGVGVCSLRHLHRILRARRSASGMRVRVAVVGGGGGVR